MSSFRGAHLRANPESGGVGQGVLHNLDSGFATIGAALRATPMVAPRNDDYRFGGGALPRIASMESPSASSFASLPTAPSISRPTGKPVGVMPANSDSPGMPALLPGSVLRIMVSN